MIKLWNDGTPPGYNSEYGEDVPGMIPFILKGEKQRAAVIVCPGGGYCGKAPHEGKPVAKWLNTAGVSAFVLDYRVYPYQHPYPLMDAKRAIRYVRYHAAQWGIDPDRIGILGFSAGGHLASTAGTHFDDGNPDSDDPIEKVSSRPDAMILCYPVITFGSWRHDGSMKALLGEKPVGRDAQSFI